MSPKYYYYYYYDVTQSPPVWLTVLLQALISRAICWQQQAVALSTLIAETPKITTRPACVLPGMRHCCHRRVCSVDVEGASLQKQTYPTCQCQAVTDSMRK